MTQSDKEATRELGEMKRKARAVRDESIVRMGKSGRKVTDIARATGSTVDRVKTLLKAAGVRWETKAEGWMLPEGTP